MFIVLLLATDEQVAACCPVLQRVGIFVVLLHLFFLLFTLMFFREQCFLFFTVVFVRFFIQLYFSIDTFFCMKCL